MSFSKVNIPDLQSLNQALPRYCNRCREIAASFTNSLLRKKEELASLENHFTNRIQRAEATLRATQAESAAMAMQGIYISTAPQEAELQRAQQNYAQYKSEMARLDGTFNSFKSSENNYNNSVNRVETQTVSELNRIIQHLSDYDKS